MVYSFLLLPPDQGIITLIF